MNPPALFEKKTMAHEKDWQIQDNKEPKYMLSTIN